MILTGSVIVSAAVAATATARPAAAAVAPAASWHGSESGREWRQAMKATASLPGVAWTGGPRGGAAQEAGQEGEEGGGRDTVHVKCITTLHAGDRPPCPPAVREM
jgi:hypothetical protein